MENGEKEMNNKSSLGSYAGKGVAPWECDPRLTRAGGRSRGLHSKVWTGLPTGDIPSRKQTAARETGDILPENHKKG